jgi:hypothetical protein
MIDDSKITMHFCTDSTAVSVDPCWQTAGGDEAACWTAGCAQLACWTAGVDWELVASRAARLRRRDF